MKERNEAKKKKAVVYIITQLELGGAQKICLELFKNIPKNNSSSNSFVTYLITGKSGPLTSTVIKEKNVIFLDKLYQKKGQLNSLWCEIACFFQMRKKLLLLKKQYGEIIIHTHSSKAGIIGRWAAFFCGIKLRIHTVHGYSFNAHISKLSALFFYLCEWLTAFITTHFICVSSQDVKTGLYYLPKFKKHYSIIRAAIDHKKFIQSNSQKNKSSFIFGTISCFKKQKNLFDLLNAFALVHQTHPTIHLEIIGDGILRPAISQWITQKSLQKNITLHGWQHNVAPIMKTWSSFILSSLWEGLPCSVIEARVLKLPIICYNTGGISDVVFHEKNGALIQQSNWISLAYYMQKLLTDSTFLEKTKKYNDSLDDFKNSTMTMQHSALYNQLHL